MQTQTVTALFLVTIALALPANALPCGGYTVSGNTLAHQGPVVAFAGVARPDSIDFYTVTLAPSSHVDLAIRAADGARVRVSYQEAADGLGAPAPVATCGAWMSPTDSSTQLTDPPAVLTLNNPSGGVASFVLGVVYVSGTTSHESSLAPYVVEGSTVGGVAG